MPTDQIHDAVTEMTTETTRCTRCGSPNCLALIRADIPPVGLLDFLDRQFKLVTSGHWDWSTVGYCTALVGLILAVTALVASTDFVVVGPAPGDTVGIVTGIGVHEAVRASEAHRDQAESAWYSSVSRPLRQVVVVR